MTSKDADLWVGRFRQGGKVFVYDPAVNSQSSTTVKLFLHEAFIMQEFNSAPLRKMVEQEDDATISLVAKSAYERWLRKQERNKRKQQEQSKVQQEKGRTEDRRTHCYCGERINTHSYKICKECRWIKCSHGHCGCSFRGTAGNP